MTRLIRQVLITFMLVIGVAGEALAGDPMLARQLTDRGIELQLAGEHAQAVRLFDAALVETDHPKIRYFRAKSLLALQRYEEAEADLNLIKDRPEVSKYRAEIMAFFNEIQGDQQRQKLAEKLEAERQARAKAESEKRLAEQKSDESAIELLWRRRSGLMPTSETRAEDGPLMKRILPIVPTFTEPLSEYEGRLLAAEYIRKLDRYDTELTAAKVLSVIAVLGVSVGVGIGTNPLSDTAPEDGAKQTGLAIGIVGAVSGLAAAVLWPSPPEDPRDTVQPPPATAVGQR